MYRISLIWITLIITLQAQFDYNPEYEWLTLTGENVKVHFHPEAERTARVVLKIADEVWGPITSLYQYEPETVHFVIKDIDDYSNGATYFFDNKIEIWASALDFDLRGEHNWLRNVISHEFTHMVQIQAAMKIGRTIPAFYLQFLNYEDKRRPDILYGFPNFIASYPLATIIMPAWFAEGTAQYMRTEFNYDNWDTHRDMILRSYVLDDNMLTWEQMGVFNKTSLGNESVYNAGFAFTRYISQKYGEDKLRLITEALGEFSVFTFDAAVKRVLKIDGKELYNEWAEFLKEDYENRIASVKSNEISGDKIAEVGFGNFYPKFFNNKLYYLSNKNADYFLTSLFEYDFDTKKDKMILAGVRSVFDFIPGTNKFIYSKISEDNKFGVKIHDLYVYDIEEKEEKRLTFGLRANNPNVSNDGESIVFIFQKDGTTNLGVTDINGKNFRRITFFENGEQVYKPTFSPDDKQIIFDYSYHQGRDIAIVNSDGTDFKFLMNADYDERNPVFTDNENIIFSSDETGIFNLYKYNLKSKSKEQISNVLGGAFMADVLNDEVVYAGYTSTGYKIFKMGDIKQKNVAAGSYIKRENPPLNQTKPNGDIDNFDIERLKNFNDFSYDTTKAERYKGSFTRFSFLPFVRYDNYNTSNSGLDKIKPGIYFISNDMLNRFSVFGAASLNKRLERDIYLNFEYRDKLPLLFNLGLKPVINLELFSVSRKTSTTISFDTLDASQDVNTDISYSLFEFDISGKQQIFPSTELELRFIYSSYSYDLSSFIIPISNQLYPTTSTEYFNSQNIQLTLLHEHYIPNIDRDINPIGRKIELRYNYEINELNPELQYDENSGSILTVFENNNFHRLELNWKEYSSFFFKGHTLTTQLRLASIFGPTVDDFFDFYLGGLIGMKSYPFYAISGNELAWANITYRFPLFKNIDTKLGILYIDKIYMSIYGDIGNTWNGDIPEFENFKKGAGAEIRIKMNSFYLFPTSLFFSAAYSFDKVERFVDIFNERVLYGKEWRFYGGILFDFAF